MASVVRVYRSTDSGAPAHPSATFGSMAALLRACLVTGYGTKDPAGWEEPFTETDNCAVFRALEGARQFYQVMDNVPSYPNVTIMSGYESMSSATAGQGKWGERYFGKRPASANGATWMVVADQRTAYVFLDNSQGYTPHVFGEYQSLISDDPYNSYIAGHTYAAGLYSTTAAGNSMGYTFMSGAVYGLGSVFTITGLNYTGAYPGHGKALASVCIGGAAVNYPLNSTKYCLADRGYAVHKLWMFSGVDGFLTGHHRGIYLPWSFRPKTHDVPFTFNGRTILPVNSGYSTSTQGQGQLWFDITDGWD